MTTKKKFSVGGFVLSLIFGKLVGDTEQERRSPTWRYQKRQNKLVSAAGLLSTLLFGAFVYYVARSNIAAGIALGFVLLRGSTFYMTGAASDAIFDSLFERINLQSHWLNHRLSVLDSRLSAGFNQPSNDVWTWRGIDIDEAYYSCPENPKGSF